MIHQHQPMKWPKNKPVDWADGFERSTWVSELRGHVFDLFVVGLHGTEPRRKGSSTRAEDRASLLANKKVIDEMMALAGAPLEVWQKMWIGLPSVRFKDPPEIAERCQGPFEELSDSEWTANERAKWLGYVEGQIDYLAGLVLAAYPEGSDGHLRGGWAVIRLKVLFEKERMALLPTPIRW